MFDELKKWLSDFLDKQDEITYSQSYLDYYKNQCKSHELVISGLEYECDKDYEATLRYYHEVNQISSNPRALAHIAICFGHLGKKDTAKSMIVKIRSDAAYSEGRIIGKLLENGFFGEPDYYEARKWYMTDAWCAPNDKNIIIARENLKRIFKEYEFDDYCYKCKKKLVNEPIYFNNSSFNSNEEFCSDCIEIAPFIYTLNPQTGEIDRSTYECDWKALANAQGEFPLLKSMFKDDTYH